jgi:hypothetical protein
MRREGEYKHRSNMPIQARIPARSTLRPLWIFA